jgi:Mrp family chromosome partitioning ATPase
VDPTPPAAEETVAEPALPFIEVGPRHLLEGSPDVLAAVPARLAPGKSPEEPRVVRFLPFPHCDSPEKHTAPLSKFAPDLVAFHAPRGPEGQRYRDLLSDMLRTPALRSDSSTALLFCSARQDAAVNSVLLNLAITAAQGGKQTIVVDGNLANPAVATALGLPEVPGLREVQRGAASLEEALQSTEQERLQAVTAGLAATSAGARFIAATMRSLLRELRRRAELVFVDGPAWDDRPEVLSLAAAVEGVCLVLPETEAETAETDALFQAITQQGVRLAGCILACA